MARKDVLRLLRNLSKYTDLKKAWKKSKADRSRIIRENGGIDSDEENLLLTLKPGDIKKYLDEEDDTAQQIQVV